MSWDFTYLIEDPITDVQLFPARIAQWSKPVAYLDSYWSDFKPRTHFVAGLFFPSFYNRFGVGAMYDHYTYNWSQYGSSGDNVQRLEFNSQHLSFIVGRPFLKIGGFLAFKLSYVSDRDHSYCSYTNSTDTLIVSYGDTSITHWNDYSWFNYDQHGSNRRFLLNQSLPLGDRSTMDISVEFCPYHENKSDYHSIFHNQYDTTINHYDPLRYVYSVEQKAENSNNYTYDRFLPSGFFTVVYGIKPTWGQLRFLGRTGLTKGWFDTRIDDISNSSIIQKYDYIYPDTHFAYADTFVTNDYNSRLIHEDRLCYNAVIGAGGTFPTKDGFLLSGIKLNYFQDVYNNDQDTLYRRYQTCLASLSLGYEWYVFKFLCLRDGVNMLFQCDIDNIRDGTDNHQETDSYIGGGGAFGFGIKPGSHFRLDFYVDLDLADLFHSWAFDMTYNF